MENFQNPLFTPGAKVSNNDVNALVQHPLFQTALATIPECDFKFHEQIQKAKLAPKDHKSRVQFAFLSAYTRWANPICEQCLDKSQPWRLFACQRCGLGFYCSRKCQQEHSAKHAARCCRPDGPLDDGPFEILFFDIKTGERWSPSTS